MITPRRLTFEEQVATIMATPWIKAADKQKVIGCLNTSPSAPGYVFALWVRLQETA